MHTKRQVERSMIARYRQAFKHAGNIASLLDGSEPSKLSAGQMQELRDELDQLSQCVHEFNAYRNVVLT
jgi:hypothetical protein